MPILRYEMSVRALYKWDSSIFDSFMLPDDVKIEMIATMILAECGELETLYPDPEYFKMVLRYWSESKLPSWNKIKESLWDIEYDPIHNYTRHTEHSGSDDYTLTDSVKGYNETSFVDSDRSQNYGNNRFTRDITGNIGNTSFSKLIEEEVQLRKTYDLIDIIVNDFKQRFCILVY